MFHFLFIFYFAPSPYLILGPSDPAFFPCCQSFARCQLLRFREETAKLTFSILPFCFAFKLQMLSFLINFAWMSSEWQYWKCILGIPSKIFGTTHHNSEAIMINSGTCVQSLLQSLPRTQMRRRLRRQGRVGGQPASSFPPPTPSCLPSSLPRLITLGFSYWVFGQNHKEKLEGTNQAKPWPP